jgi:hypothetical protein
MKSDVWLLLFSAAAVFAIMTGPRIWRAMRFSGRASWPTLPATVEQVLVHSYRGRIGRTYRAEILYSYQESGKYYSGSYMELCACRRMRPTYSSMHIPREQSCKFTCIQQYRRSLSQIFEVSTRRPAVKLAKHRYHTHHAAAGVLSEMA